jgi:hypothetical protein
VASPAPASTYVLTWYDGDIGRRTELVLIPSGQGRMHIVSPHELALGEV